jgi:hypothetical protein
MVSLRLEMLLAAMQSSELIGICLVSFTRSSFAELSRLRWTAHAHLIIEHRDPESRTEAQYTTTLFRSTMHRLVLLETLETAWTHHCGADINRDSTEVRVCPNQAGSKAASSQKCGRITRGQSSNRCWKGLRCECVPPLGQLRLDQTKDHLHDSIKEVT